MTAYAIYDKPRLVAIDDDEQTLGQILQGLGTKNLDVYTSTDPEAGLRLVEEKHPEIVVVSSRFTGSCGLDLLGRILRRYPGTDGIVLGSCASTECVVDAVKKGAYDYVLKPDFLEPLSRAVDRLLVKCDQGRRRLRALDELIGSFDFAGIVGQSPLLMGALDTACRIAPHFRTVLITGQTGTGKELTARLLHRLSPVSSRPFVVGNLSALVETLLESELFGHVRGAFTGATHDKVGLCEYADGGTLFLDEIGEMPLGAQTRLLRFLQTQEIQRVGSPQVRQLDVRVIAATNCDLRSLVAQGKFREDLFYRLSVVEIQLPPLAERKGDLPLLERHFVNRFSKRFGKPRLQGLTERARLLLRGYGWPGNIREFENALCYACMMAEGEWIDLEDLPDHLRLAKAENMLEGKDLVPLEVMQRRYIRHVLDRVGGKKGVAASVLGINRMKLYRMLKEEQLIHSGVFAGTGAGNGSHRQTGQPIRSVEHADPACGLALAGPGD